MYVSHAQPKHLADIHSLICALSAFHDDEATITTAQLEAALFGPNAQALALIATQNTTIIGYAGLTQTITLHTGRARIDIHHLYIADGHRNKGIGKALIAAAKDHAITQNAQGLSIGTDPNNLTAQAAYRGMGLKEITGTGPRFWIPLDTDPS